MGSYHLHVGLDGAIQHSAKHYFADLEAAQRTAHQLCDQGAHVWIYHHVNPGEKHDCDVVFELTAYHLPYDRRDYSHVRTWERDSAGRRVPSRQLGGTDAPPQPQR